MKTIFKILYRFRARSLYNQIHHHIQPNQKVLDIGAGTGYLSELLNKKGIDITLIDVMDYNQVDLPLILYDGVLLPFKNNSFDISLIVSCLHHDENPIEMIKDAKRVGKKIIIVEDTYTNKVTKFLLKVWDWITNDATGLNMPYNFRTSEEWIDIFNNLDLTIVKKHNIKNTFKFYNISTFVLKKYQEVSSHSSHK